VIPTQASVESALGGFELGWAAGTGPRVVSER
jgi:hypothetical protein